MKDLDEFLPIINQFAPGVGIPTAYTNIRQAAIEFCERTKLWRYVDTFDLTTSEAEGITTPDGSVLIDIEQVKFNGDRLTPKSTQWLDENVKGWDVEGALAGTPQYVTQIDVDTLMIVPFQAGTIDIRVWLKPSQDCTEVPDFMADKYREMIAHGAVGRILATPGQPYSNPNMGAAFLASFEGRLVALSIKSTTGQQRARTRTKGNFF